MWHEPAQLRNTNQIYLSVCLYLSLSLTHYHQLLRRERRGSACAGSGACGEGLPGLQGGGRGEHARSSHGNLLLRLGHVAVPDRLADTWEEVGTVPEVETWSLKDVAEPLATWEPLASQEGPL